MQKKFQELKRLSCGNYWLGFSLCIMQGARKLWELSQNNNWLFFFFRINHYALCLPYHFNTVRCSVRMSLVRLGLMTRIQLGPNYGKWH